MLFRIIRIIALMMKFQNDGSFAQNLYSSSSFESEEETSGDSNSEEDSDIEFNTSEEEAFAVAVEL